MAKISNTFWVHTALIKVERFTLVCLLMILVRPLLIVMVDRIPTKHLPEVVYLTVVRLSLTQNVTSVWNASSPSLTRPALPWRLSTIRVSRHQRKPQHRDRDQSLREDATPLMQVEILRKTWSRWSM